MATISKRSAITRYAPAGLALAVVMQICASLVLFAPVPDAQGNWFFDVLETGGLTALGFTLLFSLVMLVRRHGPLLVRPFPRLSAERLGLLWGDMKLHLKSPRALQRPPCEDHSLLASSVHGPGLSDLAYPVGHAGLAVMHHVTRAMKRAEIWTLTWSTPE